MQPDATQRAAVASATRASRDLKRIFDRQLGSAEHPRGDLLTAYRDARRAVGKSATDLTVILFILAALRTNVQTITSAALTSALTVGAEQARRDAALYDLRDGVANLTTGLALAAILALYDGQAAQVRGLAQFNEPALIIGDGTRVGALGPGNVLRETARWVTSLAAAAYLASMTMSIAGQEQAFVREAVAVLDSVTTDCCQRVDGQRVGLNEPFQLTGTPRYADEMLQPPFHTFCRTTVALVRK